ncbi:methionine ABC transporter substrate-binding protein [Corynebacterium sp. CCM 8862]|uniref:Methionine ABC transporter substrate-binding protein n=2 Tax=Corynebacterium mendelii TaxID=2765362 RepID=A0A939E0L7_9CORY|nr:methionine ABC transporter substrate-binding protein [Corynebacterium mendelii]
MMLKKLSATLVSVTTAAALCVGCSSSDGSGDTGPQPDENGITTIKLGVTDAGKKQWPILIEKAKAENINVELVPYTDYVTPNKALAEGQIDVNRYQHLIFLAQNQANTKDTLVPIASTEVFPLPLYWKGHDSLDGIEGQTVAIPNDPTNGGRAIKVLEKAGLITLKDNAKNALSPTPSDIDEANSKVAINDVDATQTAIVWDNGTPAVINQNFLQRAGIDPTTALTADDPKDASSEPYINVWVTRPEEADNEAINRITEIWYDPEVQVAVAEDTGHSAVTVKKPREELQKILDKLVDEVKANN